MVSTALVSTQSNRFAFQYTSGSWPIDFANNN